MSTAIVLQGVRLNPYVVPGTLKISSAIGSRSTASLSLVNVPSTYTPEKGSYTKMYDMSDSVSYTQNTQTYDGSSNFHANSMTAPSKGTLRVHLYRNSLLTSVPVTFASTPFIQFDGDTVCIGWAMGRTVLAEDGWPSFTSTDAFTLTADCGLGEHEIEFRWDTALGKYSLIVDEVTIDERSGVTIASPTAGWAVLGKRSGSVGFDDSTLYRVTMWDAWLPNNFLNLMSNDVPIDIDHPDIFLDIDFHEGSGTSLTDTIGGKVFNATGTPAWGTVTLQKKPIRFAGVLYTSKRKIPLGSTAFNYSLTFTDFSQLADRRLVFKTYSNTNSGTIIGDIITTYLAGMGVTAGTIEHGSSITKITYNGQSVTEALNDLADRDGYTWRIDESKKLHYVAYSANAAPWNVTNSLGNYVELMQTETLSGHRNRQFFRASNNGISASRTESYTGDSARKEFKLLYPVYSAPTIKVNTVAKQVGIKGLDSGKDFYWSKGDKIIYQDTAGTVLTGSDTLEVTYVGNISIFIQSDDSAAITERANAEGNDGLYEIMEQDSNCQYIDLALDQAQALLEQNAFDVSDIDYDTYRSGLLAGQSQRITRSDYGLDEVVLLTEVNGQEMLDADLSFVYTVTGLSGSRREMWMDYYRKVAGRKDYTVRENEVISQCRTMSATCTCYDSFSVSTLGAGVVGTGVVGGCAVW